MLKALRRLFVADEPAPEPDDGKITLADVLSFRLRERPARLVTAAGTLSVVLIYLVAQMVGAGALIQALTGVSFTPAVIGVGVFMLAYVIFGGMLATTWGDTLSILRRPGGVVLASEPYDDDPEWQEVPDRHLVGVDDTGVTLTPLKGRS